RSPATAGVAWSAALSTASAAARPDPSADGRVKANRAKNVPWTASSKVLDSVTLPPWRASTRLIPATMPGWSVQWRVTTKEAGTAADADDEVMGTFKHCPGWPIRRGLD